MTGKELIMYILENNLENTELVKDGETFGFTSVTKAAIELEVGIATMNAWIDMFKFKRHVIGGRTYIAYTDYIVLTSWKVRRMCEIKL